MIFNYSSYTHALDRAHDLAMPSFREPVLYPGPLPPEELDVKASKDGPIVGIKELGQSVPEGNRFGTFIQSIQNAIRMGAGTIELATSMGGGPEPVGVENYGIEARRELRELAKINEVEIKSIHAPSNIGNLSGYNPQERGFSDEYRKMELEEVKKAIDFAADVAGQGAIVVHTGEFPRDIVSASWNKDPNYRFKAYEEEANRNVLYLVDDRTGKLITEVRKSQIVNVPEFKRKPNPYHDGRIEYVARYDPKVDGGRPFIEDEEGKWIFLNENEPNDLMRREAVFDEQNVRFKTERLTWDHYVKKAKEWDKYYPHEEGRPWKPEEVFFRDQMNVRILSSWGSSLYHGRNYPKIIATEEKLKKALALFEKIEHQLPEERRWELIQETFQDLSYLAGDANKYLVPGKKMPSEIIKKALEDIALEKRYMHEASATADASAAESYEMVKHVVPIEEYAKKQTAKSYAEAGIHALMQTRQNKHAKGDLFVAPENIFPEMGYGSHPEELIELVTNARQKMVEYLTKDYIEDPEAHRLSAEEAELWNKKNPHMPRKEGDLAYVPNPYKLGVSEEEAKELAKRHIKATFDTQHLGMWWKNLEPIPGETIEQRKQRFQKWYMEQVKKLQEADILGHLHIVDSAGSGHHHLPAGQGGLFPVVEAVKYLKKKGYQGSMVSEGYAEDQYSPGRILTQTWRAFGNNVIRDAGLFSRHAGFHGGGLSWNYMQHSYFGMTQTPYFIFGAYAPSNDWSLWSQVPME
ncbi:MAG: TIM barrel protein [Candidatus Hadarchaeum sp.]